MTFCVAARRELVDLPDPTNAAELRRALLSLAALGWRNLVALEVIWSPAAENDRMSTLGRAKMPSMRTLAIVAALGLLVAAPAAVEAQETGGSFGGGSFGGGGGGSGSYQSSGSGSSSSSYSYSSSSDYSSSSSSGYGGGGDGVGAVIGTILILGVFAVCIVLYTRAANRRIRAYTSSILGPSYRRSGEQMDVTIIGLAIDWRARKAVQETLLRIAQHGETRSPAGLSNMLRETVIALMRAEVSWLYASARDFNLMPAADAEAAFREAAALARSGYRTEVVRAEEGVVSEQAAPEMRARSEEGEGVVAVTLCVAARRELIDVVDATDAAKLRQALLALASVGPRDLVALEVIWSPAAETDRMSTLELEAKYPNLRKIDEKSIAGRVFCEYCRGPYPAELIKCPHCGAAAAGA